MFYFSLAQLDADSSEAMEFAHQEEMKNLENRLDLKHRHEIDNLEKQHQSRMDDMAEKHKVVFLYQINRKLKYFLLECSYGRFKAILNQNICSLQRRRHCQSKIRSPFRSLTLYQTTNF